MNHPFPRRRQAFSLAELLIIISIIILVLAMAIPAFNVLTGSRSIENATNVISANLSRARLAAIRDQQPRGLVFYRDATSDRVAVAVAGMNTANNAIDVIAGADVQYLPSGITIGFRQHTGGTNYAYRLTGDAEDLYGLVMFNTRGHVMHSNFLVNHDTELGRRLGLSAPIDNENGQPFSTQPVFVLFERSPFEDQPSGTQNTWVEDNASVLLINRYNGTLTRSE